MKFIVIVWAAFLARVNPVSTMAKPACMNITRKPATSVQTKLIATVLAAEASAVALSRESGAAGAACAARSAGQARAISPARAEVVVRLMRRFRVEGEPAFHQCRAPALHRRRTRGCGAGSGCLSRRKLREAFPTVKSFAHNMQELGDTFAVFLDYCINIGHVFAKYAVHRVHLELAQDDCFAPPPVRSRMSQSPKKIVFNMP